MKRRRNTRHYRIHLCGLNRRGIEFRFDNQKQAFHAARGLVEIGQVPTIVWFDSGIGPDLPKGWVFTRPTGQPTLYEW